MSQQLQGFSLGLQDSYEKQRHYEAAEQLVEMWNTHQDVHSVVGAPSSFEAPTASGEHSKSHVVTVYDGQESVEGFPRSSGETVFSTHAVSSSLRSTVSEESRMHHAPLPFTLTAHSVQARTAPTWSWNPDPAAPPQPHQLPDSVRATPPQPHQIHDAVYAAAPQPHQLPDPVRATPPQPHQIHDAVYAAAPQPHQLPDSVRATPPQPHQIHDAVYAAAPQPHQLPDPVRATPPQPHQIHDAVYAAAPQPHQLPDPGRATPPQPHQIHDAVYAAAPQPHRLPDPVRAAPPQPHQIHDAVYAAAPQPHQLPDPVRATPPQPHQIHDAVYTAAPQPHRLPDPVRATPPQPHQIHDAVYTAAPQPHRLPDPVRATPPQPHQIHNAVRATLPQQYTMPATFHAGPLQPQPMQAADFPTPPPQYMSHASAPQPPVTPGAFHAASSQQTMNHAVPTSQPRMSFSVTPTQYPFYPANYPRTDVNRLLIAMEEDREVAKRMVKNVIATVDIERDERSKLEECKEKLTRALRRLEEKTAMVERQLKAAGLSIAERIQKLEMFEGDYVSYKTVEQQICNKLKRGEQATTTPNVLRLPKMELKSFDGNVLKWHEFWENFENSVHRHPTLPKLQKLQYLKSCLKGHAFVTVSDLDMQGDQYQVAVKLLMERYGHQNVLKKAHLDGLEKLNTVYNTYEVNKLKRLYEEVECHFKALQTINVKSSEYSATIVPKILKKLPVEVRIKLNEGKGENDDLMMEELVDGLRRVVKVLEKCDVQDGGGRKEATRSFEKRGDKIRRNDLPSGATLVSSDVSKKRPKCAFCLGVHQPSKCKKYETTKARKEVLKKYNRCYSCLQKGHMIKHCPSQNQCKLCSKGKHHEAICEAEITSNEAKEPTGIIGARNTRIPTASVAYQTVIAKVRSIDGKERKCRVLLDSGSARSFITKEFAEQIGSCPVSQKMVERFEGLNEVTQELETEVHDVQLTSLDGLYTTRLRVKTLPAITTVGNPAPIQLKKKFGHLQGLYFTDATDDKVLKVHMLLGSQHLADIQTGELRQGDKGEPVAVKTKLGWTLMGATSFSSVQDHREPTNLVIEQPITVKDEVSKLWDLETLGIKEEDPVHMAFQDEIAFKDGRYSVYLPWREGNFRVPYNKKLSEGRLKNQLKKLQKTPHILKEYDQIIRQQLDEGIIERVPEEPTGERISYIPHLAVVREDATTTKVRVVYDASAKSSKGTQSLNECLHTGPSLNPLLYSVLVRFRMYPIILMADIKQAFLQIGIEPADRDAFRFLWVNSVEEAEPKIEEFRFTRALFGAGPSPYILSATIRHHLERCKKDDREFVEDVQQSLYVDDYLSGGAAKDELIARKQELQETFDRGGFNLRKWFSNCKEVCAAINPEATDEPRKVLGIIWDPAEDNLKIDLEIEQPSQPTTKRGVLSSLAAIFDPLGLSGPVIMKARVLFQDLCAKGRKWDDELNEEEEKVFQRWLRDLYEMKYLTFPRFIGPTQNSGTCEIHVFCDASSLGCCAAVYLVDKSQDEVRSNLLTSKCRLAPLKKLTIPRLELLSARIGAKLAETVEKALQGWMIEGIFMWLDSLTALYWIANKGMWKPYVNNRIKEIHQLVPQATWHHCPTKLNPSDLGTRGASAAKLQHNKLWWEGPHFIKEGKESWPSQPKEFQPSELAMTEERCPSLVVKTDETGSLTAIINIKRFSTLRKLLLCTARVLRFVNNCRRKVRCVDATVTPEEMKDAKVRWIKSVQGEMVKRDDFLAKTRDLGAYLHADGYIRCAGRLRNAGLSLDQTHPILLPSKHKFTDLVIMESHQNVGHEKVSRTLAEVRSTFWVPRGRQVIKSLLRNCAICKVFAAKPIMAPEMAPLPEIRAVRSRPFQHTGVDFAGPLHVKSGQEMMKAYIALFTCATTRAVHLELTPDLTAPIFRMTLEKFTAAWGMPNLLVSDNATTFKTTAIQLKALFEHPEVQEYLRSHFLTWKFNLALASWWGGWFEKMVGLTKTILKKTLGKASLSYFEMEVMLKKTQAILNNRPLFYQGEELEEEILTPNHLIFGHRLPQMPDIPDDIFEEYKDMTLRLKHVEAKLNELWSRWSREYLVGLREFHKARMSSKGTAYNLKQGDIVLIENKGSHRGMWKKGRILHMITGKDGVARGASIATIASGKIHRLERPLQQIYPLEISAEEDLPGKTKDLGQPIHRKSTRAAAIDAKKKIRTLTEKVNQEELD